MELKDTIKYCGEIKLYEEGSAVMWTDGYISKELLKAHLDPEIDAGSRSGYKIDKTCRWIKQSFGEGRKKLLDLGCGPGLYAEKFASLGFEVSGIDFSQNSIDYAKQSAMKTNLDIDYKYMNYLELDYEEQVDIITLIYCDFCVLKKQEQSALLKNIHQALKPGGVFILDVHNENFAGIKEEAKTWECSEGGFWREGPHISLAMTKHFEKGKLILDQYVIIDEEGFETYRFWTRSFEEAEMTGLLINHGFSKAVNCSNILRTKEAGIEDSITFYAAYK